MTSDALQMPRAIASDGEVKDEEMRMFELLDDLLPRRDRPRAPED